MYGGFKSRLEGRRGKKKERVRKMEKVSGTNGYELTVGWELKDV